MIPQNPPADDKDTEHGGTGVGGLEAAGLRIRGRKGKLRGQQSHSPNRTSRVSRFSFLTGHSTPQTMERKVALPHRTKLRSHQGLTNFGIPFPVYGQYGGGSPEDFLSPNPNTPNPPQSQSETNQATRQGRPIRREGRDLLSPGWGLREGNSLPKSGQGKCKDNFNETNLLLPREQGNNFVPFSRKLWPGQSRKGQWWMNSPFSRPCGRGHLPWVRPTLTISTPQGPFCHSLIIAFTNHHYDLIPTLYVTIFHAYLIPLPYYEIPRKIILIRNELKLIECLTYYREVIYRSTYPNILYCGHPHEKCWDFFSGNTKRWSLTP